MMVDWVKRFLDKFGPSAEVYIDARERVVIESKCGNRLYITPSGEIYLYIPGGSESHQDIWLLDVHGKEYTYIGTEEGNRIFPL